MIRPVAAAVAPGVITSYLVTPPGRAGGAPTRGERPPVLVSLHGGPRPPLDPDEVVARAEPWIAEGFAFYAVDYRASEVLGRDAAEASLSGADLPGPGHDADDVVAAVHALAASEVAELVDLASTVLHGFSYGAYVLNRWLVDGEPLAGVRLAVCQEGVADLRTMDHASIAIQAARRGCGPEDDPEHWALASPIERASQVEVPVLLAYGDRSPAYGQGVAWREALTAAGNRPFWHEATGEGHVFSPAADRALAAAVASARCQLGSGAGRDGTPRTNALK